MPQDMTMFDSAEVGPPAAAVAFSHASQRHGAGRAGTKADRIGAGLAAWLPVAGALWLPAGVAQTACHRLAGAALLAIFVLTAAGAGGRLVARLGLAPLRQLERLCLSVSIGWAALSLLLLALASVGWFQPLVLGGAAVSAWLVFGLGIDGGTSGWAQFRSIAWRRLAGVYGRRRRHAVPALITAGVVTASFLWAAGPVWDYDSEMYHLPASQFLLDQGGLAVSLDNPLKNLPGQAYLWFALGLAAGQPSFAQLLMYLAAVVTSLMAGCFAARWIGMHTALWTPLVYWSAAIVAAVATTARVEPFYSLMFLSAVVLLYPALHRHQRLEMATVLLVGLCLGTAAGVKYQALYGWVVIAAWLAWNWLADRRLRTGRTLLATVAIFLIGIVITAPWWGKNLVAWGNPLYPVFKTAPAEAGSLVSNHAYRPRQLSSVKLLTDSVSMFARPNRHSGPPHHYPHYLFLALPLLVLRRHKTVSILVALGLGYHLLGLSIAPFTRYLFPMFALWTIAVAYVIASFELHWKKRVLFPGLVLFFLIMVLLLPVRTIRSHLLAQYLIGASDERPLLNSISGGYYESVEWLHRNTEPQAAVLMCWEARERPLRRPVIIDPNRRTWRQLFADGRTTPSQVAEYLRSQGVDYLFVNEGALQYNIEVGEIAERVREQFDHERQQLVPAALQPVFTSRSVTVYRVL